MVGVGVASEGGGGEYYAGEYYQPEQYFVPQELPQHPHAHLCTVHPDYNGMPVVTSGTMMTPMLQPVLDENMRHYLVHPHQPHPHQPHPHHQPHHQQPHHQPPPHHQPQHHYGPANGVSGPHYYNAGYPPHFHHVPPHHMQHSPPPPVYQKDERTQRQYSKLKNKLEKKHTNRNNNNNGIEVNSGTSTPSLSPRKELNGGGSGSGGASSGVWSEGSGSSAGASTHGDDEANDTQALLDLLSATRTPQVSDMTPTSALVQWNSTLPEGVIVPNIELTYDLLLLGDRDRGRYKAIYSGPAMSCRVTDLRPGCEYSVRLQIRAGELTGAASEAAVFRAPPAPPDRPAQPRPTQRARTSLLLRWNAAPDNGSRVTHYVLEMDAGEGFQEVARPRTRQQTVNNLQPQTRYRFRVAGVNDCGRGAWSEEAVLWTLGAPPPAPPPPALVAAESRRLQLAWEKRDDEEFTLQMDDPTRPHGFLPVYSGPDTTHTAENLHRATDYRFRLRAETADGQGPWSVDVTYRTAGERPAPPGRPTARCRPHPRALRMKWDAPSDDGGCQVTSYTLELDGGEGFTAAYQGPDREAHCDRLQPGRSYRARVCCANAVGVSEWSPSETVTTDTAPPAAPLALELAAPPRATAAAVRWRAPQCTGGCPITHYRLEVADSTDSIKVAHSGPERECYVRELTPGNEYRVWVTACNKVGSSPATPPLQFTTAAAPPDAPETPLASIETPHSAKLEWTAPRDNGAPIIDFRLEMSSPTVEEAYSEVYRGAETSCVVTTLTPFTAYLFRVCAVNAAGRGGWSGARDVLTPRAPPAAPLPPRCEAGSDWLRVSWNSPASHGADILRYRLQVDDRAVETDAETTEKLVEGLSPDTVYRIRVCAVNEVGEGSWSEAHAASTRPPPPAPPSLRLAAAAHNQLRLEWDAPQHAQNYVLEMKVDDQREYRPVYRGCARTCKVKKLRESWGYTFRIRAADDRGGRGAWSAPLSVRTAAAPPPAPRAISVVSTVPRVASVTWDAVDDATYVLQWARAKDQVFREIYHGPETQFQVDDLEHGGEYLARVMAVRHGLQSAWTPVTRLTLPAAPPQPKHIRKTRAARSLSPTHMAILLAAGFLVLAVVVAVLVQRLVEPNP